MRRSTSSRRPESQAGGLNKEGLGRVKVGLNGGLSNTSFQDLFQCLTTGRRRQEQKHPRSGWPDGRRRFGTVAAAVVAVLSQTGEEMAARTIRTEVEKILDGSVSRHSVSDVLIKRSEGPKALFVRHAEGIIDASEVSNPARRRASVRDTVVSPPRAPHETSIVAAGSRSAASVRPEKRTRPGTFPDTNPLLAGAEARMKYASVTASHWSPWRLRTSAAAHQGRSAWLAAPIAAAERTSASTVPSSQTPSRVCSLRARASGPSITSVTPAAIRSAANTAGGATNRAGMRPARAIESKFAMPSVPRGARSRPRSCRDASRPSRSQAATRASPPPPATAGTRAPRPTRRSLPNRGGAPGDARACARRARS